MMLIPGEITVRYFEVARELVLGLLDAGYSIETAAYPDGTYGIHWWGEPREIS